MVPRTPVFVALLSTVASGLSAEPRPSMDEYKAQKAQEEEDAKAAEADKAKLAGVNKVIEMIDDLTSKVLTEGEKEAFAYNKYACFCKDTTTEKNRAIQRGTDMKAQILAEITSLSEKRDDLDETINELAGNLAEAETQLHEATKARHATLSVYEKNSADLESAINAIDGAIDVMKTSKNPTFVQVQGISKTLQTATLMADALGIQSAVDAQKKVAMFLQQPNVEMEDYKFHSDSVIESLEHLKRDFRNEKADLDSEETTSVKEYDALKQEKVDHIKNKENDMAAAKLEKDRTQSELSSNVQGMTTVSAQLLDDQQYLAELAEMCQAKAKTWDQRTKVRADELSALTAATAIIKDRVKEKTSSGTVRFAQQSVRVYMVNNLVDNSDAMEAFEDKAEAAESSPSFLQKRMITVHQQDPDRNRQTVVDMLMKEGTKLRSTFLIGMANRAKEDPFAKIKQLMQATIEQLLTEAAEDANAKGYCDKVLSEAKQKRDYAVEKITSLNANMAKLESSRNKRQEELAVLVEEIQVLGQKEQEANAMRDTEMAENQETLAEAEAGREATMDAIKILSDFYKTVSKEEVDLGFVQKNGKGPMDDAPDAGFETGDSYQGGQGESGGILGMLDIIKSDFERTMTTTTKAEAESEKEHGKFVDETGVSVFEKRTAIDLKTKEKDDAIEEITEDDESLHSQTEILKVAINELLDLQPMCVSTGMSYQERAARREQEIEALKVTLCVIKLEEKGMESEAARMQCS